MLRSAYPATITAFRTIATGRHLSYPIDTPMSNLLVTLLQNVGVEIDEFGDSTGALDFGSNA
jgi:hypothetical protein